ncbi:SGNH/GDSL hydrolase family protein [Spirosoma sp. BT702]|uniref:SGNH/GDSL hydrolase family protein n=1 Tax=Spirosoma profusum TaxID=2771354 RepID=A0A926Y1R8_9BACT|nr:SGNH/GDSL hydrolase family protein [Spirosoma profusum]MBD2700281.1 SGNH/GDSL hydrolase family protein [Spirosoma profusum]
MLKLARIQNYSGHNFLRLVLRRGLYVLYLAVVVAILLEVCLRIYNPLNPRIKNEKIILPVSKTYELTMDGLPSVDRKAIHTKNSLGFRGEEPPKDWSKHLTVLTVGGSTTECFFLGDGTDWPARMSQRIHSQVPDLWVNNAGLNGHSTFGHQVLLDDYLIKLHPNVILFLIGINDVGKDKMDGFDNTMLKNTYVDLGDAWWKNLGRTIAQNSEVVGLIRLVSRGITTQKLNFHDNIYRAVHPSDTLAIAPTDMQKELAQVKPFLPAYRERVMKLVSTCRQKGIEPILITQPLLVGFGNDPVSHTDLAKFRVNERENGELFWKRLESYNDVTRALAADQHVHLIDLARKMPKSSEYFYDDMHFTEAGAGKVSEIVSEDLGPYFHAKYYVSQTTR